MYTSKLPFIQQNIRENVVMTTEGVKHLPELIQNFEALKLKTEQLSESTL